MVDIDSRLKSQASAILATLALVAAWPAAAQVWQTADNNPMDPGFVQVPYEVVFVSANVVEDQTCTQTSTGLVKPKGNYDIGTDVSTATKPSRGNQLWVVTRNGAVKKLFPLSVHETQMVTHPETGFLVRLIDTPMGHLGDGSVVEPNVSEDGKRVIFGFFHDPTFNVGSGQGFLSKQGADLYVMDLSSMVDAADPDLIDPATLPVQRLTFKEYDGSGAQSNDDKNKDAMNPVAAATSGNNGWGTVFMHGVEMRTRNGLKMVYASGERRNMNSNEWFGKANYNVNLHIADILADGSLGASRQFQYYTTSSAMSPTPLRNGIAYSYQSTTSDGRNWHIQSSDSEGRWSPLIGYGSNPDLFHLGAFCVDTQGDSAGNPPGDYFIATRYYNLNNNGFGALWKLNMADVGLNTYDDFSSWGVKPRQKDARKISLNVEDRDFPSKTNPAGEYWGKMTSPRCGRPDELFFAYTPTSANGKSATCEDDGSHIYHAHIGFRPNLSDFDPTAEVLKLVDDSSNVLTLIWPVPMLSWQERTGDAQQQVANSIIARGSVVTPGTPFAQVGTSSIYNTDRKPYDCWLGTISGCQVPGQPGKHAYNPNKLKFNQREQIWQNFDGLSYVQDPNDLCKDLDPSAVLGIAVNVTSNRVDHDGCCDYQTDGSGRKETARLLGVYDVTGQADQSFQAVIPSHTPFEFHLLDANYGLRLVDVRSWHSLYPREKRVNCGGCHQHEEGKAIAFAGTVASSQPPLDMVTQTQQVTYDSACNPIMATTSNPTEQYPEWKANIWPQFDTYCGACHNNTLSSDNVALAALSYSGEGSAYNALKTNNYANALSGALGSPAFWAARGERTDGRDNTLYASGGCQSSPTYAHSSGHASDPNLCGQNDSTKAAWVLRFGQWIDNHMPRDTGSTYVTQFDRYHPTADIAAIDAFCKAKKLRVGFWDDTGSLASVEVYLNGVLLPPALTNVANGSQVFPNLTLLNNDRIKVVAEDAAGNRQIYEKKVKQLKNECARKIQIVEIDPVPVPLP